MHCSHCHQELFSDELTRCPACGRELDSDSGDSSYDSVTDTHISEEFSQSGEQSDAEFESPEAADSQDITPTQQPNQTPQSSAEGDDQSATTYSGDEDLSEDSVEGDENETFIADEWPEQEAAPAEQTIGFDEGEELGVDETFVVDDDEPERDVADDPQATVAESMDEDDDGYDATIELNPDADQEDDFDPARAAAMADEDNVEATFISDDFDSDAEQDATAHTVALDQNGNISDQDDSFDETVTSEDFGEDGGDSSATFLSGDADGDEMKTLNTNWDASQSDLEPRMTIKSRGDMSVDDSGLVGETISSVPRRTMQGQDNTQSQIDTPEYKLVKVLGEGGMGIVWSARQTSVDRNVAVKMIKGKLASKRSQRQKFLAEAIVTGDLDHPNIVPIYDVGSDDTGALFYSMKQVQGTPWLKVIKEKSVNENLEILLRTADAVAFAHDRGIIHRDLKPENVMLGSYGEVLVMDWGLALPTTLFDKAEKIRKTASMGGTPAYMAPEMATGPIDRITPASDIYLLGAMLFEIITRKPPHPGRKVQECLLAAMRNTIRETDQQGELLNIAHKALATDPVDRHLSVSEFQADIREYLSHSESVAMAGRAQEALEHAQQTDDYNDYSQSVFEFQEAYDLWNGNTTALAGVSAAKLAYAESALKKGDLDLSASLLDLEQETHRDLAALVKEAATERDAKQQRLKLAKRIMMAMAICLFAVISVAFVWINSARSAAIDAKDFAETKSAELAVALDDVIKQKAIAETNEAEAIKQTKLVEKKSDELKVAFKKVTEAKEEADNQREKAVENANLAKMNAERAEQNAKLAKAEEAKALEQKAIAEANAKEAKRQQVLAEAAKEAEVYEAYIARIGLAAAKIEENAFDVAEELLDQCPVELRNWEWGRLMHLCRQASVVLESKGPVDAVAFSPDGTKIVTGSWDHTARIWDAKTQQVLFELPQDGLYVHSVAWSPTENIVVTTGNDRGGLIRFWNASNGQLLSKVNGHTDAVVKAKFSPDGKWLLTCSYDETARLWNVADAAKPQEVLMLDGHSWWVWDAAFSPTFNPQDPEADNRIVTVGQDGKAIVWKLTRSEFANLTEVSFQPDSSNNSPYQVAKEAVFSEHDGPVYAVAFAPSGDTIATAGNDKRILIWNPQDVQTVSLDDLLKKNKSQVRYTELSGHTAPVQSIAYSTDGEVLVSGSRDNAVKVWSTVSGTALKTLRGHYSKVRSVAFSPDGRQIISGGQDQRAIVWSIDDYEEFKVLDGRSLAGHRDAILDAEFSHDGKQVLTASRDRTARTWNTSTGEAMKEFQEGHDYLASKGIFFPNERTLVTSAGDNTVRLWDVITGTQFLKLDNTGRLAALALSTDGKWLVTGSDGNTVKLWNAKELLATEEQGALEAKTPVAQELTGHNGRVTAVAFAPKQNLLLTCDENGRCLLRNVESGKILWNVKHHTRRVNKCAFLPDGSQILTASNDNTVSRLDATTGKELRDLVFKHDSAVTELAISSDSKTAFTVTSLEENRSMIHQWNVASGTQLATLPINEFGINDITFVPNGQTAILVANDNTVRTLETEGGSLSLSKPLFDFQKLGGIVWSANFDASGNNILTVGGSEARLWDANTLQKKMSFSPHGAVAGADFSPSGDRIVTGSWDNSAKIWNAATAQTLRKLEGGHSGYINSVRFSPDGKSVLTASDDGTAKLWNAETGEQTRTFTGHQGRIRMAVFSQDGDMILTASTDRTAKLWNAKTGEPIGKPLIGHRWSLTCITASPDGSRILTGSEDNNAMLWDAQTGEVIATFQGHTAAITSVAFTKDGKRIFTASEDNTAKLWDATTGHEGTEVLTLSGHGQELTSVGVSPNGQQVLTSSRDGTAIIWLTTDWLADETPNP